MGTRLNLREDGTARKFYRRAGVAEAVEGGKGFNVTLDGTPLRTPARRPMTFASEALAHAVAAEWEYQDAHAIRPFTMPLMALTATSIDRTPHVRDQVVANLSKHLDTDGALCRSPRERAYGRVAALVDTSTLLESLDAELADVQAALLDPVLRRVERVLGGGAAFVPSDSLLGAPQSDETRAAVERHAAALDDAELTALDALCSSAKSVVLGLAFFHRLHEEAESDDGGRDLPDGTARATAEALRAAIPLPLLLARVEEEFQAYKWGVVEGGHDIDRADLKVRLTAPMVYLRLRSDV